MGLGASVDKFKKVGRLAAPEGVAPVLPRQQNELLTAALHVWRGLREQAGALPPPQVMSEPHGRRTVYLAGGGAVLLFILYVWFFR